MKDASDRGQGDARTAEDLRRARSALERGAPLEAKAILTEIARRAPDDAEALFLLGNVLVRTEGPQAALPVLQRARSAAPRNVSILNTLGGVLGAMGRHHEALEPLETALAIDPAFGWAHENIGSALSALGRFDDAKRHFTKALQLKPDLLNANAGLAIIAEREQDWPSLQRLAEASLRLAPNNAGAWRQLAKSQWERGQLRQAVASFQNALRLGMRDVDTLATFARLCMTALEFDLAASALAEIERAGEVRSAHALSTLAIFAMFEGRMQDAQRHCRRCIVISPDDVSAWRVLTQVAGGRVSDEDLAAIEVLSRRLRGEDRSAATYALADCLDARGRIDEAFAAYVEANRLVLERSAAEAIAYNRAAREREIDTLIARFPAAPRSSQPGVSPAPVFVVGMPRSGTTLIESVLGAHSKMFACGERAAMRLIMQEFSATTDPETTEETCRRWRAFYLRDLPDLKGAAFITDKNPWNFDALGLILQLLPNATLVHVRRDPLETGLSLFRNQFSKFAPYACRLEDIGHYYGQYARLMAHWERVLGERLVTIQYEDFVADFDSTAPALLRACGLDWEEACARFWQNPRAISTMSAVQARQPVSAPHGRAARYGELLAPLRSELEVAGVDPATGALRGG